MAQHAPRSHRLFAGGLTATLAAFVTHRFSVQRELQNREHAAKTAKEARRRNFLSFLDGFRAEAERTRPSDFAKIFPARVYDFRRETAMIRADIALEKQSKFAELIDNLCRLRDSEVEEILVSGNHTNYLGRDRVAAAIDAIKIFVEEKEVAQR